MFSSEENAQDTQANLGTGQEDCFGVAKTYCALSAVFKQVIFDDIFSLRSW